MDEAEIAKIINLNPKIDVSDVANALTQLRELQKLGLIQKKDYDIGNPFTGNPVAPSDRPDSDPRSFRPRTTK